MGLNELKKEKRRFFAITSVGRSRWYWVVWPSLEEIQASEEPILQIGEGYENTRAEAVERALELAGIYAEWLAAKYAKTYYGRKATATRKRIHPDIDEGSNIPTVREFLYRDAYDTETRQWVSVPHRVVTKTRKYVFVEQQPYSPDDLTGSWLDREHPTFRLDRRALEQEGYAFVPATTYLTDTEDPMFFSYERMKSQGRELFKCLQVLNLSWPCSEAEVKGAYRRFVKDAHPDGGGNQDKFLALQEAYEQALQLCQKHAGITDKNLSKGHS